jgi:L-cysteate sulfo-lyase
MTPSRERFARFKQVALREGPSPIQRLSRLTALLGGAAIFVKREDIGGLGGGGNKLRKLEFLMGEALAAGADTIITVGGWQSNHARLTAASAARLGLACELVLARLVPRQDEDYVNNGNILLDELFGAQIHALPGNADSLAFANRRAEALRAEGRNVYVCPLGGSSPIGCLGYAACADEIEQQSRQGGIRFDHIVVANGSGGMQAGLIAGSVALGWPSSTIVGHAVLAAAERARATTLDIAGKTLALINPELTLAENAVHVGGDHLGEGYGIPTEGMLRAVRLAASQEGLLLDPVYSGKAFAGLIRDVETGRFGKGSNILFVASGGSSSLFAYKRAFGVCEARTVASLASHKPTG